MPLDVGEEEGSLPDWGGLCPEGLFPGVSVQAVSVQGGSLSGGGGGNMAL